MAEPRIFTSPDELKAAVGEQLGYTDWLEVDQKRIDLFAEATGDHQWIHVDPERAKTGPFGATVQHGFLTLGMATGLLWEVCTVEGFSVVLNYGLNKVRFPAPLRVNSRIRVHVQVADLVFRYYL
jgi:acyl dehydratase